MPSAGDIFAVVTDAVEAREIAQKRQRLEREAPEAEHQGHVAGGLQPRPQGTVSILNAVVVKADQGGPAEALADALAQRSTSEVRVDVVHRGVGAITESETCWPRPPAPSCSASTSGPTPNARVGGEKQEQVDVRTYRIIYEAVEDVRNALEGLLEAGGAGDRAR